MTPAWSPAAWRALPAVQMPAYSSLLEQTLTEESETDDLLTQIADAGANKEALAEAKGGS